MVVYKCKKCSLEFTKKYNYDKHLSRKKPCSLFETESKKKKHIPICNHCGTEFTRVDNLKRHQIKCIENKKIINKNAQHQTGVKIQGNNNNTTTGDINNITINNYNLYAFGQEPHNDLSLHDKIKIFTSDKNPMETIILCTNLDPEKKNWHNVGYTDSHSAYGITFNGSQWENECISVILQNLIENKGKWLPELFAEIKDYFSDEGINSIENVLDDVQKQIHPKTELECSNRKKLLTHLKRYFWDKKCLVLQARQHTGTGTPKIIPKDEDQKIPYLKEGWNHKTIEEEDIKKNKIKTIKKEIAIDILKRFRYDKEHESEYILLSEMINKESNVKIIDIISRLLATSFCRDEEVTFESIKEKIKKEEEIEEIMNTRYKI